MIEVDDPSLYRKSGRNPGIRAPSGQILPGKTCFTSGNPLIAHCKDADIFKSYYAIVCPYSLLMIVHAQTTPVAQNCSLKASSLLDTKKGCTSFSGEIVPANRSSLASDKCKIVGCESSRGIGGTVLHERKTVLSQECDMVDLTDSRQLGEKSKDALIAPAKKRRFISGEYDLKQHFGNSREHSSVTIFYLFIHRLYFNL